MLRSHLVFSRTGLFWILQKCRMHENRSHRQRKLWSLYTAQTRNAQVHVAERTVDKPDNNCHVQSGTLTRSMRRLDDGRASCLRSHLLIQRVLLVRILLADTRV